MGASGRNSAAAFTAQKDFVVNAVNGLNIADQRALVGILLYGPSIDVQVQLRDSLDRSALKNRIDRLQFPGYGTNLVATLMEAKTELMSAENGARDNARKVLVLMTNSKADDKVNMALLREARKLQDSEVTIIVIGLGKSVDEMELTALASGKDNLILIPDIVSLPTKAQDVVDMILPCKHSIHFQSFLLTFFNSNDLKP